MLSWRARCGTGGVARQGATGADSRGPAPTTRTCTHDARLQLPAAQGSRALSTSFCRTTGDHGQVQLQQVQQGPGRVGEHRTSSCCPPELLPPRPQFELVVPLTCLPPSRSPRAARHQGGANFHPLQGDERGAARLNVLAMHHRGMGSGVGEGVASCAASAAW